MLKDRGCKGQNRHQHLKVFANAFRLQHPSPTSLKPIHIYEILPQNQFQSNDRPVLAKTFHSLGNDYNVWWWHLLVTDFIIVANNLFDRFQVKSTRCYTTKSIEQLEYRESGRSLTKLDWSKVIWIKNWNLHGNTRIVRFILQTNTVSVIQCESYCRLVEDFDRSFELYFPKYYWGIEVKTEWERLQWRVPFWRDVHMNMEHCHWNWRVTI